LDFSFRVCDIARLRHFVSQFAATPLETIEFLNAATDPFKYGAVDVALPPQPMTEVMVPNIMTMPTHDFIP